MSTAELKEEIHKVIERIPEDLLSDALSMLNKLQDKTAIDDETFDGYINDIVSENRELLKKLAQ